MDDRRNYMIVKDSVRKLYEAREQYKLAEKHYNDVRKKESIVISNYMFSKYPDKSSFDILMDEGTYFYTNKRNLKVTRQRVTKVVWDIDKLKKTLPRNTYKTVVDRMYVINNFGGLVEYLKSCGVDPGIFKRYIEAKDTVNKDRLNQAYETGEITMKDVSGCYTVEYGEPFIKLTEKDG